MYPDDEILLKPVERAVQQHRADPVAVAGGILSVLSLAVMLLTLPRIAASDGAKDRQEGQPFEYIEARLLKEGEIKDPKELPDRIVPALPTVPEEVQPIDQDENKEVKEKATDERQADAKAADKLRQVFDKARAFAEIQDDYVPEGRPEGVKDGDVSDPALASLGATYGRKVTQLFTERFIVPTLLSEDELKKLKAKILITVDADMTMASVKYLSKSGNAMFDDAVQTAIDRVQTEVKNLPPPPEAIAPTVFGAGIAITFNGKDANRQ